MNFLRNYIRSILLESLASDVIPGAKMIFMAGSPGAGKSTVLRALKLTPRFSVINPDDWYEPFLVEAGISLDVAGFTQQYFDLVTAIKQGEENGVDVSVLQQQKDELRPTMSKNMKLFNLARKLAKEKATVLSEEGKDFIIDGTGGNIREITKLKNTYESMGYDTAMIYIEVPLDVSLERNYQRGEKGKRRLHQSAVERSHESVTRNLGEYSAMFGQNFFHIRNVGSYEDFQQNISSIQTDIDTFLGA